MRRTNASPAPLTVAADHSRRRESTCSATSAGGIKLGGRRADGGLVSSAAQHVPAEIEAARARASRRLRVRERAATFALGLGFVAVAFPLARGAVSERTPSLWLVAFLILAYAVASRIEVEVGGALALPTQLALVPMLFIVPVAKVPLCVAVGLIVGALPDVRRG